MSQFQSHNHMSQEVIEGSKTIIVRVMNIRLKIILFSFSFSFQSIFYFGILGLEFSVILYVTITYQSYKSYITMKDNRKF